MCRHLKLMLGVIAKLVSVHKLMLEGFMVGIIIDIVHFATNVPRLPPILLTRIVGSYNIFVLIISKIEESDLCLCTDMDLLKHGRT